MTYKMYGILIASLGAAALMIAPSQTLARSGAAHGAGFSSTHSIVHRPMVHSPRHSHRNSFGAFLPGVGGFFYAPPIDQPALDLPAASTDTHYTYTYDVPWDWAHRYPPAVAPSDRPYVPSCPAETVTVTGRDGTERTVNVMRCY